LSTIEGLYDAWIVNWKGLVSPAILPLTTAHFPSAEELHLKYQVTFYSIQPTQILPALGDRRGTSGVSTVTNEMIMQRLAQGRTIWMHVNMVITVV